MKKNKLFNLRLALFAVQWTLLAGMLIISTACATFEGMFQSLGEGGSSSSAPQKKPDYRIRTLTQWNDALADIKNNKGSAGEYVIEIAVGFSLDGIEAGSSFGTTPAGSTLKVTLIGSGKRALSLVTRGSLFNIGARQTLVIDSQDLTLEGFRIVLSASTNNYYPLITIMQGGTVELNNGTISKNVSLSENGSGVFVDGGTFIMNGGTISGNKSLGDLGSGGGVYMKSGTFTMNGGTISGNTAEGRAGSGGGGVFVFGGIFTMTGGTISGNSAPGRAGSGGGVFVSAGNNGVFRITNGTIYGNEAAVSPASLKNTASSSDFAALFLSGIGSTAERGTFSGTSWVKSGDLTYTGNTIKVVNGELQ
jgi:hypothetical protein